MKYRLLPIGLASLCTLTQACSDSSQNLAVGELPIDADAALVIREVYGGGSNSQAVYTHDYVELFNRGNSPVSLAGLSIQYTSATGTGNFGATSAQLTELPNVVIAPGQSFLIQEAGTGNVGIPLPTPDYIDPTPVNISATAGKLAIVRATDSLGCNGASNPCTAAADARIIDLIGFGNANYFEGSDAAPTSDNTTAISRRIQGCADTNRNSDDFQKVSPAARNSGTPTSPCTQGGNSGEGGATGSNTSTGAAAGAAFGGATGGDSAVGTGGTSSVDSGSNEPGLYRIHDIQGRAHRSPLSGTTVVSVPGIVTYVYEKGFYFQDPTPDADIGTSEGLLVFTDARPLVSVGDSVLITGQVNEYRPGCSNCSPSSSSYANLTTTQIARPTRIEIVAQGQQLPESVVLGRAGRLAPSKMIDDDALDVESVLAHFTPETSGIDFYESLEGMRVTLPDAVAVGPSNSYGDVPLLPDGGYGATTRTTRGGIVIDADDYNPERVILTSPNLLNVDVGDRFAEPIVAVMDYSYGNYKLYPAASLPALVTGALPRESINLGERKANQIDVASLNLENLDPGDPTEKFQNLAEILVGHLGAPDIVALEEVQDDSGPKNDGVVSASVTIGKLIDAIGAAGGPTYQYRSIDPVDGKDGGEGGGNIRLVFLFRQDRGLNFVDRGSATSTTANATIATETTVGLEFSPGRVDPNNPAFSNSRKPLAGQFSFNGQTLYLIANHFSSKGGDQPLFGRFQPPTLSSEPRRITQAAIVADFTQKIESVDPNARVIVLGDLNDFQFSKTVGTLKNVGLHALIDTLPESERYSYVYEGNSQTLDHILVSTNLLPQLAGFDVVHVNAEFASRASDHDPAVARFSVGELPTARVVPYVDCIEPTGRWSYLAHFGYDNPNYLLTERIVGAQNRFFPGLANRNQPMLFLPGRNRDAFTVAVNSGAIAWQLDGYVVIASPLIRRCNYSKNQL